MLNELTEGVYLVDFFYGSVFCALVFSIILLNFKYKFVDVAICTHL